ncbi:MAG: hypothetical protein RR497_04970, partial [Oscillospiraceae bacterium]
MKKHYKRYVSLLLVVSIIISSAMPTYAARPKNYISDLCISYNTSGYAANKALNDKGYTMYGADLNSNAKASFSRYREVYLGYKTTTDPKQAITDVAMMSEQNGYSFSDYQDILNEQMSGFKEMATLQMETIKEFRVNYKNNNPLAIKAYESLNNFKEDDSGKLVGDYFLDESLTEETLAKFIFQITKVTLQSFNQALTMATAETTATNFMTRVSALSSKDISAAKNDSGLYDDAMTLVSQVPTFKRQIEDSQRFNIMIESMTEGELKAQADKNDPDWNIRLVNNLNTYLVAQRIKQVKIGDKSLYDLFMQEEVPVKELYPLVSVMSKAQIASVNFVGFFPLFQSTVELKEDQKTEISDAKVDMEKPEVISAYYGVDRAMFSDEVAVTRAADAEMSATGDKSPMAGQTASTGKILSAVAVGISAAVTVALGISLIQLAKIVNNSAAIWTKTVNGLSIFSITETIKDMTRVIAVSSADSAQVLATSAASNIGILNKMLILNIGMCVAIVLTLICTGLLIWQIWDEYNRDYTKIPKIMLDLQNKNDTNNFIRYDVVPGLGDYPKDTSGDLNGFVGERWNALYTTKDPKAGKPLFANISVFKDNNPRKENLKPVHEFGVTAATNFNNFTHKGSSAKKIYMYIDQDLNFGTSTGTMFTSQFMPPIIAGIAGILLGFAGTYVVLKK